MILHCHNHNGTEITINLRGEMQRNPELIEALEEERRKIQVFQRELPLCLELVTQAIEACKQKYNSNGQSECSEQTSTEGPVLEEFMPLKRASSSDVDSDEQQSHKLQEDNDKLGAPLKKSDWLRSVQLWNQPQEEDSVKVGSVKEVKMNGSGGAFHPFKKDKNIDVQENRPSGKEAAAEAPSCTAETGGSGGGRKKEEKEGEGQKKSRRCWSPELHKRFLLALQQLGGSQVATPTQIRKLMKVDGLTNDEVKSHLQKYRLHNRRPNHSTHNNQQAPPFVVVGGIWVPPADYTSMTSAISSEEAAGGATSNEVYAPVATLAVHGQDLSPRLQTQQQHKLHLDDRENSHSGCGVGSHTSVTTSSSVDTVGA